MENGDYKSYKMDPTIHRVNIFHLYSNYNFMYLSCKVCKLRDECYNIKHKSEICELAKDTNNMLKNFIRGHICSFGSDDFYVYTKHPEKEWQIKKAAKHLFTKYMDSEYVRS